MGDGVTWWRTRGGVRARRLTSAMLVATVLSGIAGSPAVSGASAEARIEDTTIIAGVRFDESESDLRCEWSVVRSRDESTGQIAEMYQRENGLTYQLYERLCPDRPSADLRWVPVISTETLARQAAAVAYRRLPNPLGEFAPPAHRGVVRLGTWFWVSPAVWRPVTVTARIPTPRGVISATATATPTRLTFDPGDGSLGTGATSCGGPGLPWLAAFGDRLPSPCMYTYRHSSVRHPRGSFPASLAITWRVSYSTNVGASGSLGDVQTSVTHHMTVREIQALVQR
jgi:hypothetical protein